MQGITVANKDHCQFIQFAAFKQDNRIVHGFTTRVGGISQQPYAELNMALHVGDDPGHVQANRQIACQALGMPHQDLVAAVQVHGNRVQVVGPEHRGRGAVDYSTALPDTDALITNSPGVPLSSYYADCVPILYYDPVKKCVGLAHAGWRGTVQRIASETVRQMELAFGCNPGDILVGIGPSIGPCCYQVDEPVQQVVVSRFKQWRELLKPAGIGHWKLHLWETNRQALLEAAIKPENITLAGLCTVCHNDMFFSHRAEKGKTGRMASLIMIK
ncbi:peptidoglycan editing factor PgeF [Desulfotomaculum sp. 1211_IL3151]|uniref:peptidoglycan editing factor PgeF n=1 Tax=Desulfotomaculum sp. 1211_IL3151 TaxID=3084055 RepID=UPI002FD8940C